MKQVSVSTALQTVNDEIRHAESTWGRTENSVTLLAVSKKKTISAIKEAIDAGQVDFGENYVDEALIKIESLQSAGCRWHYIGAIQSNKTKLIAAHFDWVHGVDRLKIAQRLSDQRPSNLPPLNCCIQLNIDDETSKAGAGVDELDPLVSAMLAMPGITLRGLMVIPATRTEFAAQREVFSRVRTLFTALKSVSTNFDTLSMGMSGDMEAAIAEGSTMVRIGTAIFGQRES